MECIAQVVDEISQYYSSPEMASPTFDIDEAISSAKHCIENIKNTNSFMLMTINRFLDYTKTSKGMKLLPKNETIDLAESLSMPLKCMKDIQSRIPIYVNPIPEDICSHIITDNQWLQENVLCLLSNAIKYSHDGEVAVSVLKISGKDHQALEENARAFLKYGKEVALSYFNHELSNSGSVNGGIVGNKSDSSLKGSFFLSPSMDEALSDDEREYLRIEVKDHGIGLSEEAMNSLFSPFKQAQRLAGGTGLGLYSLAKRIEALNGLCGVHKRPDGLQGSVFWFQIPYRPDVRAARLKTLDLGRATERSSLGSVDILAKFNFNVKSMTPRPATHTAEFNDHNSIQSREMRASCSSPKHSIVQLVAQSCEEGTIRGFRSHSISKPGCCTIQGSSLDVLIVDDAPSILKMTSMILSRQKHVVSTATNGAEAVKCVTERANSCLPLFDVVLMDLQMPVMDGLEATKRIREWEKIQSEPRQRLIIIGVSANSDSDTAMAAYAAGVDAFITKPFSLDTFLTTYDSLRYGNASLEQSASSTIQN